MLGAGLVGCSPGYYWQAASGEYALLSARQPISRVIASPDTPPATRDKLALVERARRFAVSHLDLPDNGSYTSYVALHRRYVVWNVFATPEFSLAPVTHCFPFAGCVAYRGYFHHADAQAYARRLAADGDDVYVGGVPAFSTLGHFDDPVTSNLMRWSDDALAGLLFHELAHEKIYLPGDTSFNESYATFVQREGLRQWRAAQGLAPPPKVDACRSRRFKSMIDRARRRLDKLYATGLPPFMMRARKSELYGQLAHRLEQAFTSDGKPDAALSRWIGPGLNNAKLLPLALYNDRVPAFAALYARGQGSWPAFFAAVRHLAGLDAKARDAVLDRLARDAPDAHHAACTSAA